MERQLLGRSRIGRLRALLFCGVLLVGLVIGVLPVVAANGPPYTLTLLDEAGNPLGGYPGTLKYRCGGSWAPSEAFVTALDGGFSVNPTCAASNWDRQVTVTVNQISSQQQDVTVDPTFRLARVNATLTSCVGPITDTPGGSVAQGGGFWHHHGTTGPSGTVSFYTFPGTIKLRMAYNHGSTTLYPVIVLGTNQVDFPTTQVSLTHSGSIRSNTGGTWWFFSKPSMHLLPGSYDFWFQNGAAWEGPVALAVGGCALLYPPPPNLPPTVDAGGPYSGDEGSPISIDGTVSDPDAGDTVTALWSYVAVPGTTCSFGSATSVDTTVTCTDDGPVTLTLTANDGVNADVTSTASVVVSNVAPTATFTAPGGVAGGSVVGLSLTDVFDPSLVDTLAGFEFAFDCGGGFGAFGVESTASCSAPDDGVLLVGGRIRDKDGGVSEYTASVVSTSTSTTSTTSSTTTTTVLGPDDPTTTTAGGTTTSVLGPDDPELPNNGSGRLLAILLGGLGFVFMGSGLLVVVTERRRLLR